MPPTLQKNVDGLWFRETPKATPGVQSSIVPNVDRALLVDANEYPGDPTPGHPMDTGRLTAGVGPLAGRVCPLPPIASLPTGYTYLPVRDVNGNGWWLVVGREVRGVQEPTIDVGASLRFFALGDHRLTGGQRTQKDLDAGLGDREKVDFPYCEQYKGNQGSTRNRVARGVWEAARNEALRTLRFEAPEDQTFLAQTYDGRTPAGAEYDLPVDPGMIDLHPAKWIKCKSGRGESANRWIVGAGERVRENTDDYSNRFEYTISRTPEYDRDVRVYRAGFEQVTLANGTPVPKWTRAGIVTDIPVQLPPIGFLDFKGEWRAIGCAWTRLAFIDTYDTVIYPPEYFSRGTRAKAALLDEARTVEIVKQSFKAVGDVVNGILTYNFSPLTESLTNAVQGEALQAVRGFELTLMTVADKLQKAGFQYGGAAIDFARDKGTSKAGPPTDKPADKATPTYLLAGAAILAALL